MHIQYILPCCLLSCFVCFCVLNTAHTSPSNTHAEQTVQKNLRDGTGPAFPADDLYGDAKTCCPARVEQRILRTKLKPACPQRQDWSTARLPAARQHDWLMVSANRSHVNGCVSLTATRVINSPVLFPGQFDPGRLNILKLSETKKIPLLTLLTSLLTPLLTIESMFSAIGLITSLRSLFN